MTTGLENQGFSPAAHSGSKAGAMVGKCVNSSCGTSFRYFHEGKLFRVEIRIPQPDSARFGRDLSDNFVRQVKWYWLCGRCSREMTLKVEKGGDVVTTPLSILDSATTGAGRENCRPANTQAAAAATRGPSTSTTDIRKTLEASIAAGAGPSFLTR